MEYELAKQLKDAGFPQDQNNPQVHTAICGNFDNPDPDCRSQNRGVAPTLEELIEACGEVGLFYFGNPKDGCNAWTKHVDPENYDTYWGETPIIAVARLWLALNKNSPKGVTHQ